MKLKFSLSHATPLVRQAARRRGRLQQLLWLDVDNDVVVHLDAVANALRVYVRACARASVCAPLVRREQH